MNKFTVSKNGLFWVGGGWTNAQGHAFIFSRFCVAKEIAGIVGGEVVKL